MYVYLCVRRGQRMCVHTSVRTHVTVLCRAPGKLFRIITYPPTLTRQWIYSSYASWTACRLSQFTTLVNLNVNFSLIFNWQHLQVRYSIDPDFFTRTHGRTHRGPTLPLFDTLLCNCLMLINCLYTTLVAAWFRYDSCYNCNVCERWSNHILLQLLHFAISTHVIGHRIRV